MRRMISFAVLMALVAILWGNAGPQTAGAQQANPQWQAPPSTGDCRFATTYSPVLKTDSIDRYDLPLIGTGYYLNWMFQKPVSVPSHIRYVAVLSVTDGATAGILAKLPAALAANPGGIWIIGNEPEDRSQDRVTAEVYAERYFAYATRIRLLDNSAKIAFGPIVMPTPLRLMYLDFAWARLIELAGSQAAASALVDIWTPHNFILNEEGGRDQYGNPYWGSGVPWGFETRVPPVDWFNLQQTISLDILPAELYNFAKFRDRMIAFRQWMKDHGEQNKPVWLTEYGQLAPPYTTPQENLWTVDDLVTADFMLKTMDWMLTAKSDILGMPGDENRLVQKWFWFSINHNRYQFGGTLIDPVTLQQTPVGYALFNYVPPAGSIDIRQPDLYPLSVSSTIMARDPANPNQFNYRLNVRIRNAIISDHFVEIQVKVKDGATTLATNSDGRTGRCGGDAVFTFALNNLPAIPPKSICVEVAPLTLTDVNMANNTQCVTLPTIAFYLPTVHR